MHAPIAQVHPEVAATEADELDQDTGKLEGNRYDEVAKPRLAAWAGEEIEHGNSLSLHKDPELVPGLSHVVRTVS